MEPKQQITPIATPAATPSATPWQTHSWRRLPKLTVLCICGSVIAMSLAIVTLTLADDSPIDSWTVAPTVYLSIIVTLANAMLRFASSEGADLLWWSRLLSPKFSTTLSELHTAWDLKNNALSLVQFKKLQHEKHLQLRSTLLLVLLLAVNGPLLQRAVTVKFATQSRTLTDVQLPLRREPMWNLTSKKTDGESYHPVAWGPPFQEEVAGIFTDMHHRQPMLLAHDVCGRNATCRTNVVIAGFERQCSEYEVPVAGARTWVANEMFPSWYMGERCGWTGFGDDKSIIEPTSVIQEARIEDLNPLCGWLETDFQISIDRYPFVVGLQGNNTTWKDPELPPDILSYLAYRRPDSKGDTLIATDCLFFTAFVELGIEITNGRTVTITDPLLVLDDSKGITNSTNTVESIPKPVRDDPDALGQELAGISQIIDNMYWGSIMYDRKVRTNLLTGPVRQYIDQSSIALRDLTQDDIEAGTGANETMANGGEAYRFSTTNPLSDVVNTLNEVSLRYALASIPSSPARLAEMEAFYDDIEQNNQAEDLRDKILPLMETAFVKEQVVHVYEEGPVALYSVQYAYLGVAVGLSYLTSLLVLLLLRSVFSTHGRKFSMSPLEIARAFNAPILVGMPSNATGDQLAASKHAHRQVKYGELNKGKPVSMQKISKGTLPVDAKNAGGGRMQLGALLPEADNWDRLGIDEIDHVGEPLSKRTYV